MSNSAIKMIIKKKNMYFFKKTKYNKDIYTYYKMSILFKHVKDI